MSEMVTFEGKQNKKSRVYYHTLAISLKVHILNSHIFKFPF